MKPEKLRADLRKNAWGRLLLGGLSLCYGAAVLSRRLFYALGILSARRLPAKVVCIGNLTTGGTGKTPAVLLAAQTLRKRDHPVAILSRGYGRAKKGEEVTVLLDDNPPPWTQCGDEPWMMHHALQGQNIPILVASDRFKAGNEAVTFYHSKVLILDDGFQHLRLKRDLDIVLINATDPFGGGRLLPSGNLREPIGALSRAHLALLTHVDRASPAELSEIRKQIRAANPALPILESMHKADFLFDLRSEKRLRLNHLSGGKAVAFSGIADPASFETQLEGIGVRIAQRWRYPDHHPYRIKEMEALERLRQGMPVVTTFKDSTRFPQLWRQALSEGVFALGIRLEIHKGKNIWTERLLGLAADGASAVAEDGEPA